MAFFLFRTAVRHNRLLDIPKRLLRTRLPSMRRISRGLRKTPSLLYGSLTVLCLATACFHLAISSSLFHAIEDASHSIQNSYSNSDVHHNDVLTKRVSGNLEETERLTGLAVGTASKGKIEGSQDSNEPRSYKPPSYLPLAQYLKSVNYTRRRISLRDMVFGVQKRTYPDLQSTDNSDLLKCEQCSQNCKALGLNISHKDHQLQLARLAVRLVTFYNFSSMAVFPCTDEIHWVLPLNAAIQRFNPRFMMYCAVSSDQAAVDLMKKHNRRFLAGSEFIVYQPAQYGNLPKVDVLFTWRGLEQFNLDAIQEVFKEAVKEGIKTILVGNSPGYENAKVVETGEDTFSVRKPEFPGLNVRGYPFGFNEAMRVFSFVGKQLLFYNTSSMRDGW